MANAFEVALLRGRPPGCTPISDRFCFADCGALFFVRVALWQFCLPRRSASISHDPCVVRVFVVFGQFGRAMILAVQRGTEHKWPSVSWRALWILKRYRQSERRKLSLAQVKAIFWFVVRQFCGSGFTLYKRDRGCPWNINPFLLCVCRNP